MRLPGTPILAALARKSARQEGTIERSGPLPPSGGAGSTDPTPMVMEQFEVIRKAASSS